MILDLWEELFKFEHQGRTLEELRKIRKEKSKIVVDQMQEWLMAEWQVARPESEMRKAIQYCTKHWRELTKFLEDPLVPLTNNEAERTIRQAVMGRKNFYGSRSINGADVTAILYTVIESCKKVELDPREYLLTTLKLAAADNAAETPFEMAQRLRQ